METPPLLIFNTQQEYIDRLRTEYHGKNILLPDGNGKRVLFFLEKDKDCTHAICGKSGIKSNPFRAQRILWIKFVLETASLREVKQSVWQPQNLVFFSEQLGYVIVCNILAKGDLKFITQYMSDKVFKNKWSNQKEYYPYSF